MHQFHHNLLLAEMRKFDCDSTVIENMECVAEKQDQGSKVPSRDHPNSSIMTRQDYIAISRAPMGLKIHLKTLMSYLQNYFKLI